MRRLPFRTIDVFTRRSLEGNPLAVFPDAPDLSEDEMLAIAREMNLSETTFVVRRDPSVERARGIRTRIFTTAEELPFAGHPTLGTAAVLRGMGAGDEVALELTVGTVPVRFSAREGRPFGEMRQIDPTFGNDHDPVAVATAIGVSPQELRTDLPIQTVSTGVPFVIVPFARLAILQRWAPDWTRLESYLRATDARLLYAVCQETVAPDAQLHARMVFYRGEDPATGSAAGPTAAWMVRNGLTPPGHQVLIEQGLEIHRPSRIYAQADLAGDQVTNVRVGGFFVPAAQGELSYARGGRQPKRSRGPGVGSGGGARSSGMSHRTRSVRRGSRLET